MTSFRLSLYLAASLISAGGMGCDDGRQKIVNAMTNKTTQRNAKIEQALNTALLADTNVAVKAWREFINKWPSAKQSVGYVWHEDIKVFDGNLVATAVIENRYVLKAVVDFEVSADCQKITFPKLRFHFAEVKNVILPPDGGREGGATINFQPDQSWFGYKEWKQLVESQWDFGKIGITVISNLPVPNIRKVTNF